MYSLKDLRNRAFEVSRLRENVTKLLWIWESSSTDSLIKQVDCCQRRIKGSVHRSAFRDPELGAATRL